MILDELEEAARRVNQRRLSRYIDTEDKALGKTYKPTSAEADAFRRIDGHAPIPTGGVIPFTPAEIEALKAVAAREMSRQTTLRTGKVVTASYKLHEGLRDAIKRHAEARGLDLGEALSQAIELYLMRKGG